MKTNKGLYRENWQQIFRKDPLSKWDGKILYFNRHFFRVTGVNSLGSLLINGNPASWVGSSCIKESMTCIDVTGWGINDICRMVNLSEPGKIKRSSVVGWIAMMDQEISRNSTQKQKS